MPSPNSPSDSPPLNNVILEDLAAAAFEGGINYWAPHPVQVIDNYSNIDWTYASDALARGYDVVITEDCDQGTKEHILTRERFATAIQAIADLRDMTLEEFYNHHDAIDADAVVQWAIFGDVIYG